MGKYFAIYKCPMCNRELKTTENPIDMDHNDIPEMLAKIMQNQKFFGNPYLYEAPLYIPHKCKNGDGGLARLIGFRNISNIYPPSTDVQKNNKKKNFYERLKLEYKRRYDI